MVILRPDTCSTCPFKFAVVTGGHRQLVCRRMPPVAAPIYNPHFGVKPGQEPIIGWQTTFPLVQSDWSCGEHPGLKGKTLAPVQDDAASVGLTGSA